MVLLKYTPLPRLCGMQKYCRYVCTSYYHVSQLLLDTCTDGTTGCMVNVGGRYGCTTPPLSSPPKQNANPEEVVVVDGRTVI